MFRRIPYLIWLLLIPLTIFAERNLRPSQLDFINAEPAPARDEAIELSYHDQDNLGFFMSMPNDYNDHSYYVRFTLPELPVQLLEVKVLLFNMMGDAGNPGMRVTLMDNDDGFPGEPIHELEIAPEDLILNDDENLEWTSVDLAAEELMLEEEEDFFVVFNVVQFQETDTLAILMDDGEAQPSDRSGFFGEREGWTTISDAYGVGANLAVNAVVDLPEFGELELSADVHDFGEVAVGEERIWDFRLTNIGDGFLYVNDVSINGVRYQLDWTQPRIPNLDPWDIRADFPLNDAVFEGVVFIDDIYYVSGREEDRGVIWGFDEDGELLVHIDLPEDIAGGLQGMTFDWNTELIWGVSGRSLYGINLDGDIVEMIDAPIEPTCIAWDRRLDLFWICQPEGPIFGVSREGDVEHEIQTVQNISKQGLAYWPWDPDGMNLYILTEDGDNQQNLLKMDVDNGEYVLEMDEFEGIDRAVGGMDIEPFSMEFSWVLCAIMEDDNGLILRSYQLEEIPGLAPGAFYEGSARFAPDGNGEFAGRIDITTDLIEAEHLLIELRGTGVNGRDPRIIEVPGEYDFIQMAIEAAINRDTILVHPGRYVENIDFIGKRLVLGSLLITTGDTAYIDSTILDGNEQSCTVVFRNREDSLTVLRGFTITGGLQNFGGGIDCQEDVCPQLLDLKVTGNTVWQIGAGIYCTWYSRPHIERVQIFGNSSMEGAGFGSAHEAHPELVDVIIYENTAEENGGGLYAGHGSGEFTLRNVIITRNSARFGGGVYLDFAENVEFFDVTIEENTATGYGGGIYSSFTDPWIEDCTINGNLALESNGGGAAFRYDSYPTLINTVISYNGATSGGGVYADDNANPYFERCVICNNQALLGGGGIDMELASKPVFLNSILYGNGAGSFGNAMSVRSNSEPLLINSILWNHGERSVFLESDSLLGYAVVTNCDIENGVDAFVNGNDVSLQWLEGNIDQNPLFMNPDEGDYYPTIESPCIDAGTAFFAWDGDTIIDLSPDEYYGEAPDIGIHETNYFSVDESYPGLIEEFGLRGNYPNPFNSSTVISFQLNSYGMVSLNVYDLNGRLVTALVNDSFSAGKHTVKWDATGVSTGLYLIRLKKTGMIDTRRMLLLK